jgi:hypothetical protein
MKYSVERPLFTLPFLGYHIPIPCPAACRGSTFTCARWDLRMATCDDFDGLVAKNLPAGVRQEVSCDHDYDEAADCREVIALARQLPDIPPPPTLLARFWAALAQE